ncbi:unnamed protein product [Alternaria alternata]
MSPFSYESDVLFDPTQRYDTLSDVQSVDGGLPFPPETPSVSGHRTTGRVLRSHTSQGCNGMIQADADRLGFLPLAEWDEHNSYEEDTPSHLRYSIEWKIAVNNRAIAKDTEQDVVLAPAVYWRMYLQAKVEKLVDKKLPRSSHMELDDISVVASVKDRSESDLTRRFDDMNIDWSVVERQFMRWSEPFRAGKKLKVSVAFNYTDSVSSFSATASRGSKRGSYATQRMLADRASQLDAEQQSSGQPSAWVSVYSLMRCPGSPCNLGPYCWRDPFGKQHYKLNAHHLRALVRLAEQGHRLESHDDVPADIRDQLYAENQRRLERRTTTSGAPTPSLPPITINNVMPSPASESPLTASVSSGAMYRRPSSGKSCLDIPGPRDIAVAAYGNWQQSKVVDQTLQLEYQKACNVTLQDGLDLEQVFEDQDADFFIQSGVKRGVARRFVRDIETWAELYRVEYTRDTED